MKRCIVVLGVHRSGTSLMAGLLNIFGGYLGGNLLSSKDDNVRGFFEHAGLLEVNEVVLEELNSSWRGYDNFPKNWHKKTFSRRKKLIDKYSPANEKKLIKKLIHKVYSCYN